MPSHLSVEETIKYLMFEYRIRLTSLPKIAVCDLRSIGSEHTCGSLGSRCSGFTFELFCSLNMSGNQIQNDTIHNIIMDYYARETLQQLINEKPRKRKKTTR